MAIAIVNGTVLGLERDEATRDGVVLIDERHILEVGPAVAMRLPSEARVIDADGGWVMPGLINLHAHFSLDGERTPVASMEQETLTATKVRAARHASEALQSGVTTVRDLGSRAGLAIELRDAITVGDLPGPTIIASGLVITNVGGHGIYVGKEAEGLEEVRRAVREQLELGADVIKIMASGGTAGRGERPDAPGLSLEEMAAAVEEAHARGVRVTAHAHTATGIRDAVEAGIDGIEHGTYLDDEAIEAMVRKDVPLVSTLSAQRRLFSMPAGDPDIDEHKARAAGQPEARIRSFQRAISAGVRVGAGSDAGVALNRHDAFADELGYMVEAGLSRLDALRSATCWAAQILGIDSIGRLQSGALADLLVLVSDPRQDLEALGQIRLVMKGGKVIPTT